MLSRMTNVQSPLCWYCCVFVFVHSTLSLANKFRIPVIFDQNYVIGKSMTSVTNEQCPVWPISKMRISGFNFQGGQLSLLHTILAGTLRLLSNEKCGRGGGGGRGTYDSNNIKPFQKYSLFLWPGYGKMFSKKSPFFSLMFLREKAVPYVVSFHMWSGQSPSQHRVFTYAEPKLRLIKGCIPRPNSRQLLLSNNFLSFKTGKHDCNIFSKYFSITMSQEQAVCTRQHAQ